MSDTVTLLQAKPWKTTAKIIRQNETIGFNAGTFFAVDEVEIGGIRDLGTVLEAASDPELRRLVIRGKPLPATLEGLAKNPDLGVRKMKLAFGECARRWALFDFDSVQIPGCDLVGVPEAAVRAVIDGYLPDYFRDATCFWQFSSRAGLDPGVVKVHLWFWLDRLVGSRELKRWAKICAPAVDGSLFHQIQAHYIARPKFEGVLDPLPRRTGFLEGSREEVQFPTNWFEAVPADERAKARPLVLDTYEDKMESLGDGDGLDGFNEVLLRGVWAYVADGNTDFDWLKDDVRERLLAAPRSDARDVSDVARYGSDEYLDASVAGARAKLEEQAVKLPLDVLQKFARNLSTKPDERAEVGMVLLKVCRGEVFAEIGVRDYLLPKIVTALVRRFRDYDPLSIARLFGPSLSLMPGLTVEDLTYQIRVERESLRQEQDEQNEERERRIRDAFQTGRSYSYTPDEVEGFGPLFKQRLVIQMRASFYNFVAGAYRGPYSKDEVLNTVVRDLAPVNIELFRVTKSGDIVQKTINQIVQQYGTVADDVMLDLAAQETIYNEDERTIIEAPCPVRLLTPKFHPEIDRWLQLLGGKKYEKLKSWCAAITMLKKPCRCLFITGIKGVGKGLFALGVARVYALTGPVPLTSVFSDFNDLLATCPICLADEQLPKDHRGHSKSAELREHIQAVQRSFRRKNIPDAKMLGATRTIVTANNEDVLATQENLTKSDIEAITDRYLHCEADPAAVAYLKDVDTSGWVDRDMIAEHVLWLVQNHVWTPEGRFLIEDDDPAMQRSVTTKDVVKAAVCEWLTRYLQDPQKFDNDPRSNLFVRKKDGRLLVNVQGLTACWDHYVTNPKCPTTGVLARALAGLCENDDEGDTRVRYQDARGRYVKYRVVDMEYLIQWAEKLGIWERDEILRALTTETSEKRVGLN